MAHDEREMEQLVHKHYEPLSTLKEYIMQCFRKPFHPPTQVTINAPIAILLINNNKVTTNTVLQIFVGTNA